MIKDEELFIFNRMVEGDKEAFRFFSKNTTRIYATLFTYTFTILQCLKKLFRIFLSTYGRRRKK